MLSKMIWMHLGSHKAKHDAVTMWKRGGEFNPAHLRTQALKLGLAKGLAEVEEAALPGHHPRIPRSPAETGPRWQKPNTNRRSPHRPR